MLEKEQVLLLDKLYDYSSDDSTIIVGIKENINVIESQIKDITDSKENEENVKKSLEDKLSVFLEQAALFKDSFSDFDNSSFSSLSEIGINLSISDLMTKLVERQSGYEEDLNSKIDYSNNVIEERKQKLIELDECLENKNEELNLAFELKDKLKDLIDEILVNGNVDSYTRNFIKNLLGKFNSFSEEEILSLEYLILFPEKGLKIYEEKYKGKEYQFEEDIKKEEESVDTTEDIENIEESKEVEEETTEDVENVEESEEVPKDVPLRNDTSDLEEDSQEESSKVVLVSEDNEEDNNTDDFEVKSQKIMDFSLFDDDNQEEFDEIDLSLGNEENNLDELIGNQEEDVSEEKSDIEEEQTALEMDEDESFINELSNLGLEYEKFGIDTIFLKEIFNDFSLMSSNINNLRELNVDESCLYYINGNYSYLMDNDLSKKIYFLKEHDVSSEAIAKQINKKCLTISYNEMIKRYEIIFKKIIINDDNLEYLNKDVINYENNLNLLANYGNDLDVKEQRNFEYLLMTCKNMEDDLNILSKCKYNLLKKNGKYALKTFFKDYFELLEDIDLLIENNYETFVVNNPEILEVNGEDFIKKANCLKENDEVLLNQDGSINDLLIDDVKFMDRYGSSTLERIVSFKEVNSYLPLLSSNKAYVIGLINVLDKFYYSEKNIIVNDNKIEVFNILKNKAINNLNMSLSNNTYCLGDFYISKNRFERNLSIIVNNFENIKDEEIILISLLYNSRFEQEKLQSIARLCLEV